MKNIIYPAIILGCFAAIGEVGLRILNIYDYFPKDPFTGKCISWYEDKYASYYEIPAQPGEHQYTEFQEFNIDFVANNIGYRDNMNFVPGVYSLTIVMGDSFAESNGASNDSTWPKILQSMIGTPVWNCGSAGTDPCDAYVIFRDKLMHFGPRRLILTLNETDIFNVTIRGGLERFHPDGTVQYNKAPAAESIYRNIYLSRIPMRHLFRYDFVPTWKEDVYDRKANELIVEAIDSLRLLCEQISCELIVAYHPLRTDYEKTYRFQPAVDRLLGLGVKCVDIRREFSSYGITAEDLDKYYWPIDGHFNNTGYYYFAKSINKHL